MPEFFRKALASYGEMGLEVRIAIIAFIAIATTAFGTFVIVRLPANHFCERPASSSIWRRHPILRVLFIGSKNLLGAVMLPLGILMSVPLVPGPGLVFVVLGLSLLDFPGKRRVELALVRRPTVRRVLTKIRARYGQPPFQVDEP